ncbi:cupin [Chromatiales bacterium (ex Bugula neritina AB1)]|nr:cupin [Chromatiales bacterium (ex Bugula neritina AB1)]
MTNNVQEMESRIVRYGDLKPCRTAFIDAHTPGSDQKENFTIIGAGVSESADQHVHINDAPGFNIGAAGQPPRCRNSLHTHTTAEVFFILKGRWRFFWGRWGNAGEVVLEEGDLINLPTHMFRGFENIGTDYGMIMAVLGGNDAGGGVTWAPQVIEEASDHGLVLGNNGVLYDSRQGQSLPAGIEPMPVMTEAEIATLAEPSAADVVPNFVARYLDMIAMSDRQPALVLGAEGMLVDRPGFTVELLSRHSISDQPYQTDRHEVLMVMRGHWVVTWSCCSATLAPGDTCAVPPGVARSLKPSMTGEASLFRVVNTDDSAGPTQWPTPTS